MLHKQPPPDDDDNDDYGNGGGGRRGGPRTSGDQRTEPRWITPGEPRHRWRASSSVKVFGRSQRSRRRAASITARMAQGN